MGGQDQCHCPFIIKMMMNDDKMMIRKNDLEVYLSLRQHSDPQHGSTGGTAGIEPVGAWRGETGAHCNIQTLRGQQFCLLILKRIVLFWPILFAHHTILL